VWKKFKIIVEFSDNEVLFLILFHKRRVFMKKWLRIKILFFFILASILFSVCLFAQPRADKDQWSKFRFLIGEWVSVDSGQPDKSEGSFIFKFDLDENILVRTNETVFPAKTTDTKAIIHRDLLIIYPSEKNAAMKAIYFDSEKHMIQYSVSFPENKTSVAFESENTPNAPRFRLSYEIESNGLLSIDFSIAPPGSSFKTYLKGLAKLK
jgi:hypothetical protein